MTFLPNRHILLTITLLLTFSIHANAQRIVGELEANADMSTLNRDTTKQHKGKVVPADIRAWNIDGKYGNRTATNVDTLQHMIQNNSLSEGMEGEYNTLGNLGSPRINRIFMDRRLGNQFMFVDPYDQFVTPTDQFKFYNTKSPYMNLSYNFCGSKTTGYDNFKATYTNNAGKKFNIGGLFNYMYGQGYYDSQSTSFMNATGWTSFIDDRYDMHLYYTHNYMKMAENGGITDERYITHPEDMNGIRSATDIPTALDNTWNRQEHDFLFLNHRYHLGFSKLEGDSTNQVETFVPVTSFFHTLKLQNMMRNYKAYEEPENYYNHTFPHYLNPNDSINDRTRNFAIKNLLGISLAEGFNKWAVMGINAYVGLDYRNFTIADSIVNAGYGQIPGRMNTKRFTENNFLVGGQLIRQQGKLLHYNVDAEFVLAGTDIGQFDINGHGELNVPLNFSFLKDTMQIALNAYIKNIAPTFYMRHYHSKHAWWDNDLSKENRTRIEGVFTLPKTDTRLRISIENISNYTYLKANGEAIYDIYGRMTGCKHSITPTQESSMIQVISAALRQNFKFGPMRFENNITFQKSTNSDVLPLPTLSTYHNLYVDFRIAKVMQCHIGADMKYFTSYYAPDYSPMLTQFVVQNKENRIKVGNYPLVSLYANFDLKRTRFYIQYYHINQGSGRYFWAPNYPMNPGGLHFGLSWNFYD